MRVNLSSAIEVAGILCVVVAGFAVDWRLGLALIGAALMALGHLADASPEDAL